MKPRSFTVTLPDLVRYAGAGGDFNPIHWNPRVAREVGLPDAIAHGMFTLALAARYVTDWAGDPGALQSLDARFSAPVVVPDDGVGTVVDIEGEVVEWSEPGVARVELRVTCRGTEVLKDAAALVRVAR